MGYNPTPTLGELLLYLGYLLPVAFLLILSALRSPYLDAYHRPGGAVFLAGALSAIGGSYLWMLRWLRLPAEPRLAVAE